MNKNNIKQNNLVDALLCHSNSFIVLLSNNFNIIEFNRNAEEFYQCSNQKVQSKNFLELCQSIGYDCPIDVKYFDNKNVGRIKNFTDRKNHINWVISPMTNSSCQDIDGVILIGEHLSGNRHSLDYFMEIMDCIPGCLYWKDCNGYYLGCNPLTSELAGLSSVHDIVGKTDKELWGEQASTLSKHDEQVLKTGKTITVEEKLKSADGRWLTFTGVKMPLKDENNNIIGIIGNSLDITAQKEAEVLKLEKEMAEIKMSEMKTLAAAIAHELRTPLAAIKHGLHGIYNMFPRLLDGYEKAMLANIVTNPIRKDKLKIMHDVLPSVYGQTDKANLIIDLILRNIGSEHINTDDFIICYLMNVLNDAIEEYPFTLKEKNLVLLDENIDDFIFEGDPHLIKQVIWNILKNAIYFIHANHKGNIQIYTAKTKKYNELHIRDTAKGMHHEEAKHIFDAFYTKRSGGTGIGLHFSKITMAAHRGDIICVAEEEKYAEFILQFPRYEK